VTLIVTQSYRQSRSTRIFIFLSLIGSSLAHWPLFSTIPKRYRQRRRNKRNERHTSTKTTSSSSLSTTPSTSTLPPTATINSQAITIRYSEELALGLNEVTRALEKGTTRLVVVCRDVHTPVLIQHLPVLAQHQQVPLCLLPTSPFTLAQFFGLRTLIAFAFKVNWNSLQLQWSEASFLYISSHFACCIHWTHTETKDVTLTQFCLTLLEGTEFKIWRISEVHFGT
jgi:ribosomal protein L7Ae-like RNA K-turn-binding protein